MNMDTIDLRNAIGLSDARLLMRGRNGEHPSVETLRRWADPSKGCKAGGRRGPRIFLKALLHHGLLVTFPAWVEEFERQRLEMGLRNATSGA